MAIHSHLLKACAALVVMLAPCLGAFGGPDTTLLWDTKRGCGDEFNERHWSPLNRLHSLESRLTNEVVIVITNGPGGIGLIIGAAHEGAVVKRVAPDTPACQGGVQAGDIITEIDTQPIAGTGLRDIALRLRGPVGSEVDLTLTRQGRTLPLRVKLWRQEVSPDKMNSFCEQDAQRTSWS